MHFHFDEVSHHWKLHYALLAMLDTSLAHQSIVEMVQLSIGYRRLTILSMYGYLHVIFLFYVHQ